jgi:hypothetical protein
MRRLMNWPTQRSGEKKLTTGFQHPKKFLEKNRRVIDMLQGLSADDCVNRIALDGKSEDVANHGEALVIPLGIPLCEVDRDIEAMRKERGILAFPCACI